MQVLVVGQIYFWGYLKEDCELEPLLIIFILTIFFYITEMNYVCNSDADTDFHHRGLDLPSWHTTFHESHLKVS